MKILYFKQLLSINISFIILTNYFLYRAFSYILNILIQVEYSL